MNRYADLEIGLHRHDAENYAVELRFNQPESETEIRLLRGEGTALVQFDTQQLRRYAVDTNAYGQALSSSLFVNTDIRQAFQQARASAQSLDVTLRLRLFIGPSAPELHNLRWESLRDPQDDSLLLTDEQLLFSRYLSSFDWRPVRLRPKAELKALLLIANPTDLSQYQPGDRILERVDVAGEQQRAVESLHDMPVTTLASGAPQVSDTPTVNNLITHLRDGYDILYLVAHGTLIQGEPLLWLEQDDGTADVVAGSELIARMRDLQQRPRLIVLASCQSAGTAGDLHTTDEGALAALGPRLAEAGIPAVLAMQGNITAQTIAEFMPHFFRELQRDGQIDRAMAAARGVVSTRPDWWIPVLFMRLKSGRIWYIPGFAGDPQGFKKWPALLRNIRKGRATPILGPGLLEKLFGHQRDIARRWAERYNFPMAPHNREDLPQVSQYLSVNQEAFFPHEELAEHVRQEIIKKYGDGLMDTQRNVSLQQLLEIVGTKSREWDPTEPHNLLAQMPFPIYITTNPDTLLTTALTTIGKHPHIQLCPWNEDLEHDVCEEDAPDDDPDEQHPLVYHLFGHLHEPDSVVLTEDNYFDYLIGTTRNNDLIPEVVRRALTDTALIFLGFQMDDWNFRVFFRSIMQQEGRGRRSRYAHVAVQIDPEEGRILEPEGARRYLESYFGDADISIFWGSVDDFVRELHAKMQGQS